MRANSPLSVKKGPHSLSSSRETKAKWFIGIVGYGFIVIVIGALLILGIIGFSKSMSLYYKSNVYRYCLQMNMNNIYEGQPGDDNGIAFGHVTIDLNDNTLSYNIIYDNLQTVHSMFIRGPSNSTRVGKSDTFIPSTGTSLDVTPTGTNQNILQAKTRITRDQATAIIKEPSFYYIIINTFQYINGAIGDRLGKECRP